MGMILLLVGGLVMLFAGYPIIQWVTSKSASTYGAYGIGGINSTGQVPDTGLPGLIDKHTPNSALTRTGFDGKKYVLMFSDEFETDGRTFWPGDDPVWEAVDIHYWATGDFEWYDPDAITTKDGSLVITLTEEPIHGLNFRSGMLQSWNKFCFTGGYIEVSIRLPGSGAIGGYWPGAWTMGNLGRAGHGATTDGVWPYSYDACDLGTLPNQTNLAGTGPAAALNSGSKDYGGQLSYLPGQKLSACTCAGSDHPGPNVGVGRGAPEIDIIEAQVSWTGKELVGSVSQSAQFAPYDDGYQYKNTTGYVEIYDDAQTYLNEYLGGVYQQAVSGVTYTNPEAYSDTGDQFSLYGWEANADAANGGKNGYITWVTDGKKAWTMDASAVGPNSKTGVDQRLVAQEPMYIILNLGISSSFQTINWAELEFPATMLVDYVRVYQREDEQNIGCDTATHPTSDYIQNHLEAYMNPNRTTWEAAGYTKPKNSMQGC
ncbi:glycoside hydrolase family 16 protein [Leucosporidium creatinivorum]|uniref:Glycoside hydrolase family 16 protein n=1 Tax=Leucosporidium creatinivorum TaxID=106004 RepID=A0A1Y2EGV8_9BASI|nr:glycoside hydrolase family 16 protein [Leucosporidium creatinivorum]